METQKITTLEGDFATYRYDGKGELNPLKPPTVCDRIYTKHIGGVDDKDKYDYVVSETFLVKRGEDHRVPCVRVHAVLGDDNNASPEKDERETVEGEVSLAENGQRFFPEDDEHDVERETVEGEVSFDLNKEGAVEEGDEVDLAENDDHRSSSRLWKSPMVRSETRYNSHRKVHLLNTQTLIIKKTTTTFYLILRNENLISLIYLLLVCLLVNNHVG